MIVRSFDRNGDIIVVRASGAWTIDMVEDHYADLRRMIATLRAEGRPVRILSDVSAASRQQPEIEDAIRGEMARTFETGDRVAIVLASAADQAHVRERTDGLAIAAFRSRLAAEIWLCDSAPPPRGRPAGA